MDYRGHPKSKGRVQWAKLLSDTSTYFGGMGGL